MTQEDTNFNLLLRCYLSPIAKARDEVEKEGIEMSFIWCFNEKYIIVKYKLDRCAHSVYSFRYHLIFVIKYRRKVFTNHEIVDFS